MEPRLEPKKRMTLYSAAQNLYMLPELSFWEKYGDKL